MGNARTEKPATGEDFLQQGMACMRQYYGFVSERLRKDAEFGQQLIHCDEPLKAFDLWGEFGKEIVADYQEEARTLQAMTIDAANNGFSQAQSLVGKAMQLGNGERRV